MAAKSNIRQDNLRYTCGHTGHVVLPDTFDNHPIPVPALKVLQGCGGSATQWECLFCWESRRMVAQMRGLLNRMG